MIVGNSISLPRLFKIIWKRLLLITTVAFLTVAPLIYFQLTPHAIDRSIPLVIGTAMAIFLGFRTNSAYERWWEARIIWGDIQNDSLNLGRLSRDLIGVGSEPAAALVRQICYRQIAWAYLLGRRLKEQSSPHGVHPFLTPSDAKRVAVSADPTLELLLGQGRDVAIAKERGWLDSVDRQQIQDCLTRLTNHMGRAGRIKHTNFPVHYAYFTEVFIWIFLLLLGFSVPSYHGFDENSGHSASYIAIPAIVLIGWVFFMVDGIAQYMQAPFENNRNVIPMHALARKIEIGLRMTLGEVDLPTPVEPVDNVLS